ncbi:MAG TPA: DsbA family protein [Rhabdaerophilum sp.]|nr:DsbA family protein [Rhabdaerophilum sp.]
MERPRLLYFADTMCSWCYGFAPEMATVLEVMGDRAEMILFSGGLRPFQKEPMPPDLREKLRGAYERIASITGRSFAPAWFSRPDFVYDSEPASRAVVTMRHLAPGREYAFMSVIQKAFYADGEDITQATVLARHAPAFGVSETDFLAAFESEAMKNDTLGDFRVAQQFGVSGFPTLVLHRAGEDGRDEFVLIAQGYSKAAAVIERLEAGIAGAPAA